MGSLDRVEVTSPGMVSTVLSVWAWAGIDSMTVAAMIPTKTLHFMWFLQNERYGTYDDGQPRLVRILFPASSRPAIKPS